MFFLLAFLKSSKSGQNLRLSNLTVSPVCHACLDRFCSPAFSQRDARIGRSGGNSRNPRLICRHPNTEHRSARRGTD